MKRDITGEAMLRVSNRVNAVRERMAKVIPYGPKSSQMTPVELRRKLNKINPATLEQFIQRVGDEEYDRMMLDIYGDIYEPTAGGA